jgi:hypothetical protein
MLVEPLSAMDVNVPGVMAILVAPADAQLSVLVAPEFMLVGSAVKEVIVGTDPFPEDALDGVIEPQSASPTQAIRIKTSEQTSSPEESRSGEPCRFQQNELVESMRDLKQTQSIAHAVVAVALRGPSP